MVMSHPRVFPVIVDDYVLLSSVRISFRPEMNNVQKYIGKSGTVKAKDCNIQSIFHPASHTHKHNQVTKKTKK